MYTPEMLESIKKVEATRPGRLGTEPGRMDAAAVQSAVPQASLTRW